MGVDEDAPPHSGTIPSEAWFGCMEPERPNDIWERWESTCAKCVMKMELVFQANGDQMLDEWTMESEITGSLLMSEALAEYKKSTSEHAG